MAEDTTIASAAALIAQTLRDYGCDVEAVFRKVGIDSAAALQPEARLPVRQMQQLWRAALEASGDPCLSIALAERMQPAALHGLGFAWLVSETLMDALERLVRYQRVISTVADFRLQQEGDEIVLVVEAARQGDGERVEFVSLETGMAVFVRMCRLANGSDFSPARVTMRRSRPPCAARFDAFYAAPVEYGAKRNALYFPLSLVQKRLPNANPELARINDRVVADYLGRFERGSLSMQVRALLIDMLPRGQPDQAEVARALNMSARNLQRRLRAEGKGFRQLLDETRRELAIQYLQDTRRSIGEITYLLGFSEPSNFTRAFRRWKGISPNEFRRRR